MDEHNNEFESSINAWREEHGDDFYPHVVPLEDLETEQTADTPGFFEVQCADLINTFPGSAVYNSTPRDETLLERAVADLNPGDAFRIPDYALESAKSLIDTVNVLRVMQLELVIAPVGHEIWRYVYRQG